MGEISGADDGGPNPKHHDQADKKHPEAKSTPKNHESSERKTEDKNDAPKERKAEKKGKDQKRVKGEATKEQKGTGPSGGGGDSALLEQEISGARDGIDGDDDGVLEQE